MATYPSARHVAAEGLSGPTFCLRPHAVTRAARWFASAFPGETYYAVKANPEPWTLSAVRAGGVSRFDVASLAEVRAVAASQPGATMAFMHPIKPAAAIAEAYRDHGVRIFALDHIDELHKILAATGHARDITLVVRLAVSSDGARIPLSAKFGAQADQASGLLRLARQHARRLGLAFHTGSQQTGTAAFAAAMTEAERVVVRAGVILDVLDVGGGFPAAYPGEAAPVADILSLVATRFEPFLSAENSGLWCEPGRALVAEGASLLVTVQAVRGDHLHIDDGLYGALYDAGALGWRFPVRNLSREGAPRDFALYGPTCDDADRMEGPFALPADTQAGDVIEIGQLGAYGRVMATGFNGFGQYQEAVCTDDPFGTIYTEQHELRRAGR